MKVLSGLEVQPDDVSSAIKRRKAREEKKSGHSIPSEISIKEDSEQTQKSDLEEPAAVSVAKEEQVVDEDDSIESTPATKKKAKTMAEGRTTITCYLVLLICYC